MAWEVIYHPEYEAWLMAQPAAIRDGIAASLKPLEDEGPQLGRPRVDTLYSSEFENLKGLRVQIRKAPYRIIFAFDPIRRAVLLLGRDQGKDKRWYKVNIRIADERLRDHLARMEREIRERESKLDDA